MEIIKSIFNRLEQLKVLFGQVKRLSSWTNFKPRQDREAIDQIIDQRQTLLDRINGVVEELRPLKGQLSGMNVSDVVKEIMLVKYQELGELLAQIETADRRLMARIEKGLCSLKEEMAETSNRQLAAASYIKQSYSLAS
jgi:hypothetical protein